MNLDFRQIASKLSPKGWLAVGGSVLVGFVVLILTFNMASSPSYSTVVTGVNPAQTGKITSALSTAGISYELQNNGTAVAVQSSQEAQARVVLGGQGLLAGTGSSQSLSQLLSSGGGSGLGASQQQQLEQEISALEQQLQQQIDQMNGINSAQVVLAIPNPASNLFASTSSQPTGSVLLNTTSTLSSSAVKAIAEQVANAVPSLSTSKVTITDQNGDLLWPNGSGSTSATATGKLAAQQNYDQQMAAKAEAILASTVGSGKAVVQVNADLNANQQTVNSLTYGTKALPSSVNTSSQKLTGSGVTPGAAGNTATNVAAYAGAGTGKSNYTQKSNQTAYVHNKTISHQVIAPGAVNRQTISVLLNASVPKSEIPAIQSAVENAVGFQRKRDTISVGTLPFAKPPAIPAPSSTTKMIGYVKYVAIGLAALLFLLFVTRMLRRRETEAFAGNPTWLRELDGPRPLAALEAERQMIDTGQPTAVARLRSPVNLARQQVEDLVDRDPERVAAQVRQWMTED